MEHVLAYELMVGNIVKPKTKIDLKDYKTPDYIAVDTNMIRDCEYYCDNWAWEPVPLTIDMLVNSGFTVIEKTFWIWYAKPLGEEHQIELRLNHGVFEIFINDLTNSTGHLRLPIKIKYLHQLQNLYRLFDYTLIMTLD